MGNKKSDSSRLFQMALNDVIKSNAPKLERNNRFISTKEVIPQAVKPNHEMASKQKNIIQLHGSISPLPCSKDFNKPCQKTFGPPTECIADCHLVSLSINSSNCSSTSNNPISVMNCPTSISPPISVCGQGTSQTGCSNSKWVNPPSCNLSTFCNCNGLSDLHGDQSEFDLFPQLLTSTTKEAHFVEESETVAWPLKNELCSIRSTIPAPMSADDFFNSSSYINRVNALDCETVITNPKSCNILPDPFPFDDEIGYQKGRIAIPSPKGCNGTSSSFTDAASLTNRKVSLPSSKDCLSSFETFNNYEDSEYSIPSPKSPNFFTAFPFGDPRCLSNSGTIPGPKSYNSFDSCVPLTGELCCANCDTINSAKQFGNRSVKLNSVFYQSQSISCRSNCSSLKFDEKAQYSGENIPKSYIFDNCDDTSDLRDCKTEMEKSVVCDNLFTNDYLDELIKMGSKDPDISSRPSTSIDSGLGFPFEDNVSNVSLGKSSTCPEPEFNAFSFIPKEQSSKVVCLDKSKISADCKAKFTARSTKFSEYCVDRSDFLDDQQRIDNLINQFIGL